MKMAKILEFSRVFQLLANFRSLSNQNQDKLRKSQGKNFRSTSDNGIYPKKIVPRLNRFYRGHFQNTLNFKTFYGCAPENCQKECALNYNTYANEIETLKCI